MGWRFALKEDDAGALEIFASQTKDKIEYIRVMALVHPESRWQEVR
jgi:hypothetical protein